MFKSAFEILLPQGMMKAFLVRCCGKCVGFNLFLVYKGQIFDWYRGSDRQFSSYRPESLLVWQILKWGSENNFHTFDFGGAGKPHEMYGPRIFKSRWGGTLVNYGRNICVHSPSRKTISQLAYSVLRKVI